MDRCDVTVSWHLRYSLTLLLELTGSTLGAPRLDGTEVGPAQHKLSFVVVNIVSVFDA